MLEEMQLSSWTAWCCFRCRADSELCVGSLCPAVLTSKLHIRARGGGEGQRAPPHFFENYEELLRKRVFSPPPPPPPPTHTHTHTHFQSSSVVPGMKWFTNMGFTTGAIALENNTSWMSVFPLRLNGVFIFLVCDMMYRTEWLVVSE